MTSNQKNVTIFSLVVALGISLFSKILFNFDVGPSQLQNAPEYVKKFRDRLSIFPATKSYGSYYDVIPLKDYLNKIEEIEKQTSANGSSTPPPGYKWVVGFYWIRQKDVKGPNNKKDSIFKHDFCMVPTLVDTLDARKVKDYFSYSNNHYYNHTNDALKIVKFALPNPHTSNAYDAGQLWP